MRKSLLDVLVCPNTYSGNLEVFAHKLRRNDSVFEDLSQADINEEDEIISGIIINRKDRYAYPIVESIPVLLSDADVDQASHSENLRDLRNTCPVPDKEVINITIDRQQRTASSSQGIWNREEMDYYDRAVLSPELRSEFLKDIQEVPVWHLFIPRKTIIEQIEFSDNERIILEVGCGNARTVSWVFHPAQNNYAYIGSDISFNRLLLAKIVLPEGDFVQCSAFNLPFKDRAFSAVIGFGVFHHLPDPLSGILCCVKKIKQGGFFACHEPISKPKMIHEGSKVRKRFVFDEKDKHDNDIDPVKTRSVLKSLSFREIYLKFDNTILRSLTMHYISKIPVLFKNRGFVRCVILFDRFLLKSLGRISKKIGPTSLFYLAKKSSN